MSKLLFSLLPFIICYNSFSQTDTSKKIYFSGYIEPYFAYASSEPAHHELPSFLYSHNRHNEITLNLGYIKAQYQNKSVRANFALMTGTYAEANLANEAGIMKNIFEANAGISLTPDNLFWIDAGIFHSHIGFENARGKDCYTLTRSLVAENSPYYESGINVSYTTENGELYLSGLILNGWQQIRRSFGDNAPSFGTQIQYKLKNIVLNSSTFIGKTFHNDEYTTRYFHNFYGKYDFSDRTGIILGFDIGFQQAQKGSSEYISWYSPVVIFHHAFSSDISIALRGEYYSDKNRIIIQTEGDSGTALYGYSFTFDYAFDERVLWRNELRGFSSDIPMFGTNNPRLVAIATTSMAVTL